MSEDIYLSVVVPLFNEEESVPHLIEAVRDALDDRYMWELVLVDDGSWDGTAELVESAAQVDTRIRPVRLARNYGQTPAMQAGFDYARGQVVVSMDGDLQNDPRDIPKVVSLLVEGPYDLVAGYRLNRQDKLMTRRVPSWVANRIIRWMTGVAIRDNGCSLKGYRRELLDRIHLYSDMHRFIPAVAAATTGARIAEVPVRHHPRRFGRSKYGLTRIFKVLGDLLTIKMIKSFRERPLRMFGLGATAAMLIAVAFGAAAAVAYLLFQPSKGLALVLPGSALLFLELSVFLVLLGLTAEHGLHESGFGLSDPLPLYRELDQ